MLLHFQLHLPGINQNGILILEGLHLLLHSSMIVRELLSFRRTRFKTVNLDLQLGNDLVSKVITFIPVLLQVHFQSGQQVFEILLDLSFFGQATAGVFEGGFEFCSSGRYVGNVDFLATSLEWGQSVPSNNDSVLTCVTCSSNKTI